MVFVYAADPMHAQTQPNRIVGVVALSRGFGQVRRAWQLRQIDRRNYGVVDADEARHATISKFDVFEIPFRTSRNERGQHQRRQKYLRSLTKDFSSK
jgi:hypothetical protein